MPSEQTGVRSPHARWQDSRADLRGERGKRTSDLQACRRVKDFTYCFLLTLMVTLCQEQWPQNHTAIK